MQMQAAPCRAQPGTVEDPAACAHRWAAAETPSAAAPRCPQAKRLSAVRHTEACFQVQFSSSWETPSICAQVGSSGDTISCCAMSPTGQALALGTQGGYVHLLGMGPQPRVTASGAAPQRPVQRPPVVPLQEGDSFALAPSIPSQVGPNSYIGVHHFGVGVPAHTAWPPPARDREALRPLLDSLTLAPGTPSQVSTGSCRRTQHASPHVCLRAGTRRGFMDLRRYQP